MDDKFKFRQWLAAIPFAVLARLLFLGEGANAMSPNAWLFWLLFCFALFAVLMYGYVRANVIAAWTAISRSERSSRAEWTYFKPFAVLLVTLAGFVGLLEQAISQYNYRVAIVEKREGIDRWFGEWTEFRRTLSNDKPAPKEEFNRLRGDFARWVTKNLTKAEQLIVQSPIGPAGVIIIPKLKDQDLHKMDSKVETWLLNLKVLRQAL